MHAWWCADVFDQARFSRPSWPQYHCPTLFVKHVSAARWLAAGGEDACLSLWDLDEMAAVWSRATIDGAILSLTFSYGSAMLAYTEDRASAVTHLDVATGRSYRTIIHPA